MNNLKTLQTPQILIDHVDNQDYSNKQFNLERSNLQDPQPEEPKLRNEISLEFL